MASSGSSRRSVLGQLASGFGAISLAGTGWRGRRGGSVDQEDDAPPVEWRRTYHGDEQEYDNAITDFIQTRDGGYALAGNGRPIGKTGPEEKQFSLLKTDGEGNQQWIGFANDSIDGTEQDATDVIQAADGGFVVVGAAMYPEGKEYGHRENTTIAEAAKFGPDGSVEWLETLNAYENEDKDDSRSDGNEDSARFETVAPAAADGGFVAGGRSDTNAWLVKFGSDGEIEWHRTYADWASIDGSFVADAGGYLLRAVTDGDDHTVQHAIRVDASGSVRSSTTLDIDYEKVPYNHVLVPLAGGEYALTGRYFDQKDVVLVKVGEDGTQQWVRTYNGPYDGTDWGFDLVRTTDGGYAVGGYMSAAYSGDQTPTILKTDGSGNEEWRTILTDGKGTTVSSLVQTHDGGYAGLIQGENRLVKLAPERGTHTTTATPATSQRETGSPSSTTTSPGPGGTNRGVEGTATNGGEGEQSPDPGTGTETGSGTGTGTGTGTEVTGPGFGAVATVGTIAAAVGYFLRDVDDPEA